jgi:ribonucleoside-triphosphate reductase
MELHGCLVRVLEANIGRPITTTTIVDIMNLIGKCVVAGNVRRTAEIVFGDPNDEEYLSLKDHWWNPLLGAIDPETGKRPGGYDGAAADRADFSWTSNNSVFCKVGQDYKRIGRPDGEERGAGLRLAGEHARLTVAWAMPGDQQGPPGRGRQSMP